MKYLREAKVTLQEYEFPSNKVANISTQTNMLIEKKCTSYNVISKVERMLCFKYVYWM